MYHCDLNDRPIKQLFEGVTGHTFWGEKMMLSRVVLEPNSIVPMHSHPHEQAGIIVEGEMEFTIGDETRTYIVGEMYIIPGNVAHSVRTGNQPAVALDIFSPVREEYK